MASRGAGTPVSVALCTYNGAAYIEAQLLSILRQSEPVAEVVVGDDGSRDDTLTIVKDVAKSAGSTVPVRIAYTNRVGGIRANAERTLAACRGELIALADQDDVWHQDKVSRLIAAFAARPTALMIHTDARIVDADGEPLGQTLLQRLGATRDEREALARGDAWPVLLRRNLVTGATAALRRDLLDLALPIASSWVHDEWLAILAASRDSLMLLDEPLVDYRVHGGNQIGAHERTLGYRFRRLVEPRGDRLVVLARRAQELTDRLDRLGSSSDTLASAQAKRAFDDERARYPRARYRRIGPVARLTRRGGYGRFASQRRLDIARDLLQAG